MNHTTEALLADGRRQLESEPSGELEAELLLCHALDCQRSFLYANPGIEIPQSRCSNYQSLLDRRKIGEPIAYILGYREFWSLKLEVTRDTLVPRPDTETLVEAALARIPSDTRWRVADLGTGTGAIALALAVERPRLAITATDLSRAALTVAQRNAIRHEIPSVLFQAGSWFEPLDGRFEMIVSNPPYVAANDPHLERGDCRFEPESALSSGADGLSALRLIIDQSVDYLRAPGWLILEHGYDQAMAIRGLLEDRGFVEVQTMKDLAGVDRVSLGRLPETLPAS